MAVTKDGKGVAKACLNKMACDKLKEACKASGKCEASCCQKDLCNGASILMSVAYLTVLTPLVAVYNLM